MLGYLETADHLSARQFFIAVKKLADSLGYGTDRSPFLGSGIEYAQSRPYQPGDPVRSIDWRVTARRREPYVKEYEAPKQMPCYLLIDTSASMTVSSATRSKYAIAIHIAGGLAFVCLDRVSPVGVIGVGERDLRLKPSLSQAQVMRWLHELRQFSYDEPTTLGRRVTQLAPTLTSRCLVIVLSDLHNAEAVPALKRLAQKHDVVVIRLQDPAEEGVRGIGFVRAGEAETGRVFVTRGSRRWTDPAETTRELRRAEIDNLLLRTDKSFVVELRNFLKGRDVFGRGKR